MANSVDQDQTAPRSSLFWVHTVCFYTLFISKVRQLFAAASRRLQQMTFSDAFFLGALGVNTRQQKGGHNARKPVFRVPDQVRLKPTYSATETGQNIEILRELNLPNGLSRE